MNLYLTVKNELIQSSTYPKTIPLYYNYFLNIDFIHRKTNLKVKFKKYDK